MKILLASNNKHKAKEINEILYKEDAPDFELLAPADLGLENLDITEDGDTLEENARKKAAGFYEKAEAPCFADDTGLEIDALGGMPGVRSARYSGVYGDDAANRAKVLAALENVPDAKRTARFRTVICYFDGSQAAYAEGICEGRITNEERGANGFGYDPIFIPDGYRETFAEMAPELKNRLSHRAKAAANFVELLKKKAPPKK